MPTGTGAAERESNTVIGITDDSKEEVMPGLIAGRGHRSKDPYPGSDAWTALVQAGINQAIAYANAEYGDKAQGEKEFKAYKFIAEKKLPVSFIYRQGGILMGVRKGWEKWLEDHKDERPPVEEDKNYDDPTQMEKLIEDMTGTDMVETETGTTADNADPHIDAPPGTVEHSSMRELALHSMGKRQKAVQSEHNVKKAKDLTTTIAILMTHKEYDTALNLLGTLQDTLDTL